MTKICPRCNKGSKHFTEWDEPEGYRDGSGNCQNYYRYGGCVGEWTCRFEEPNAIPYELFGEVTTAPADQELTPKQKQERKILKLQEQLAQEIKKLAAM